MHIRDRVKELKRIKASDLLPNGRNWRTHPQQQRDAFRDLVQEIGFTGAELCYYSQRNAGALTLIDGHMRQQEVGDAEIPCLITDLNDEEADKLLVTYDPLAALAEADTAKLDALLQEIHSDSVAVQGMLAELASSEGLSFPSAPEKEIRPPENFAEYGELRPPAGKPPRFNSRPARHPPHSARRDSRSHRATGR
jgi:hypothetical protein